MRVSDLTKTLSGYGWQIAEQTKDYVYVHPPRGVERSLLIAYVIVFTGFVLAGIQLAAEVNLNDITLSQFVIHLQTGDIDRIIREDGEYLLILQDGTRERYLDPAGTLFIRLEQSGFTQAEIDALPLEVRGEGDETRLFERMLVGLVPLVIALSGLFIGGLLLLARLSSRREYVFKLDDDRRTILMEDRRGTWEFESKAEFEQVARQRSGVSLRVVWIVWLIVSLFWLSGVILLSTVVAASA